MVQLVENVISRMGLGSRNQAGKEKLYHRATHASRAGGVKPCQRCQPWRTRRFRRFLPNKQTQYASREYADVAHADVCVLSPIVFFFLEIVPSVLSSVKFFMLTLYNSVWMDVRIHVYCIYVLFDFIFNMDGVYGFLFYS